MSPDPMPPELDPCWSWKSWLTSANDTACGFPLQNLPFCAFTTSAGEVHLAVGIGTMLLDLHGCVAASLFTGLSTDIQSACQASSLNDLMLCGREASSTLRATLMLLLKDSAGAKDRAFLSRHLRPIVGATFRKPVAVPNYTDFYASIHHATNVGRLFRPDQPLLPNYKYIPIGYHGRASSLIISGTPVARPSGQTKPLSAALPGFGPSQQLDYELEVGAYICQGNRLGEPIPIAEAEHHLFGLTLLNDWSARDIQSWEYQPLGPFLGKSFATTVAPWVVTMDALAPYRVPLTPRGPADPQPLPYLTLPDAAAPAIHLHLEAHLTTAAMREASQPPVHLSSANLRGLYWSFPQMIAHHTSNGCNLLPGDLLASGTISGAEPGTQGSLLEITSRGTTPLRLPNGETRSFLEDGDEVILTGFCQREGLPRIALGSCCGTIISASSVRRASGNKEKSWPPSPPSSSP